MLLALERCFSSSPGSGLWPPFVADHVGISTNSRNATSAYKYYCTKLSSAKPLFLLGLPLPFPHDDLPLGAYAVINSSASANMVSTKK